MEQPQLHKSRADVRGDLGVFSTACPGTGCPEKETVGAQALAVSRARLELTEGFAAVSPW